ncbi:tight adherence pilus pseudopilin TadF [Vibrio europaeus]|uniref:tight adherence pilus pseudopilin TadF n=1 Tax=Vibrio europaeus TaxID=300876 RepID=UPI00148B515A
MLRSKQKGVFAIELAFILLAMTWSLYFCFDLGYQQMRKSQLERVSYSLVSLLKERSLFYSGNPKNTGEEAKELRDLGSRLLGIPPEKLSVVIERRTGESLRRTRKEKSGSIACIPVNALDSKFDIPLEKSGKFAPVYQVTLCQSIPAWFEKAVGSNSPPKDRVLTAYSAFLGR